MTQIKTKKNGSWKDVHLRMSEEGVTRFVKSIRSKEPLLTTLMLNSGKDIKVKLFGARTSQVTWELDSGINPTRHDTPRI